MISREVNSVEESYPDSVLGKEFNISELKKGRLILEDHLYLGNEPVVRWQFDVFRSAAEAAGLENSKFAVITCSDDANFDAKYASNFHGGAYDLLTPGAQVDIGELQIAFHKGHLRHVVLNIQHIGEESVLVESNRIKLYGQVTAGEDCHLRANCGALAHALKSLEIGKKYAVEKGELNLNNFSHLAQIAHELKATYDLNDPIQYSQALWRFTVKHAKLSTKALLEGLAHINKKNGQAEKFLVFEGIAINRFRKYAQSLILIDAYMVEGDSQISLSKNSTVVKDKRSARKIEASLTACF